MRRNRKRGELGESKEIERKRRRTKRKRRMKKRKRSMTYM